MADQIETSPWRHQLTTETRQVWGTKETENVPKVSFWLQKAGTGDFNSFDIVPGKNGVVHDISRYPSSPFATVEDLQATLTGTWQPEAPDYVGELFHIAQSFNDQLTGPSRQEAMDGIRDEWQQLLDARQKAKELPSQ